MPQRWASATRTLASPARSPALGSPGRPGRAGPFRVVVRAPATTANLGPAFDAAGLALDWWDSVEVRRAPGTSVQTTGEDAELLPTGPDNRVLAAMRRFAEWSGAVLPAVHVSVVKGFPLGRGFGSSAAGAALGLLAAQALLDAPAAGPELLDLGVELEGHPDNAAACLAGGATICWREAGGVRTARLPVHPDLLLLGLVSPQPMATRAARDALPGRVDTSVAAHNAGRAALLAPALAGAFDLLLPATEDMLHQPVRLGLTPRAAEAVRRLRDDGHAAALSGAGPSLVVLTSRAELDRAMRAVLAAGRALGDWPARRLEVAHTGAEVVSRE